MKKTFITLLFLLIFSLLNAQNNTLDFDGTNEYVATTSAINLSDLGNDLTLEAWIYVESFQSASPYISSIIGMEDDLAGTALIRLGDAELDSNKVQFVLSFDDGETLVQFKLNGTTGLNINTWYHVAATFERSTLYMKIYINGVQEPNTIYGGYENDFTANDEFYIGAISGPQRYLDGKIDEVRVWSTPRTQAEIRANMYKELAGSETGLVAYYKLNEATGSTADNAEGTSTYDGTLNNMEAADWVTSSAIFGSKNGLQFTTDDYVSINSVYGLGNTSATVECWVNLSSTSEKGAFVHIGNNDVGYGIGVGNGDWDNLGNGLIILYDIVRWIPTGVNIGTGWHHVLFTIDANGDPTVFLDGENIYSDTGQSDAIAPTGGSSISSSQNSIRVLSNGTIDEVRVWNNIRTETEIRENMCKTLVGDETGLVAYYNFDNTSGATLQDFSGNSNDGIRKGGETGTSTSTGSNTLTKTAAGWTPSALIGKTIRITTSGKEQERTISANTTTEITVSNNWNPALVSSENYEILDNDDWVSSSAYKTWLNTDDVSWIETTNWSDGGVPDQYDNVGIPYYSDGSHPTLSGTTACNNLVVGNGVTLTHYTGSHTIHGSAFVIGHSDINNGYFLTVTKNLYILPYSTLDIDPGGQLTIGNKLDIWANGTCTVKSDASGTGSLIVQGSSADNITFQRYADVYAKGSKWHYVSSPVAGQSIDGTWMSSNSIAQSVTNSKYQFFLWDELTNYWIIYDDALFGDATFIEARGYCLTRDDAGELSFTGTVRTSDVDYLTTHTAGEGDGFNLVGNPFTSSIGVTNSATSSGKFLADNTARLDDSYEALYIWDEQSGFSNNRNDYKVICNAGYSGFGSSSAISQHYVSPGQAFMVKVVSGGGDLAFNTNMQDHNNATFYKNDDLWPSVELIVENDELFNSTAIGFNENMTKGLDPSYDVGKLKGNPDIALYTKLIEDNGVDFTIQALPYFEQDYSVKVGLDVANAGEYTFEAATMEQIPEEVYVYFEDKLTATVTNLKETDNYTCVISEAGSITNRFVLHFTLNPFNTDEINANQSNIQIWSANKTINILNPENLKGQIRIINMYGQKLIETPLNGNDRQQITINIPTGNYVVNIVDNSFSVSKKIFIGN